MTGKYLCRGILFASLSTIEKEKHLLFHIFFVTGESRLLASSNATRTKISFGRNHLMNHFNNSKQLICRNKEIMQVPFSRWLTLEREFFFNLRFRVKCLGISAQVTLGEEEDCNIPFYSLWS